MFSHSFFMPKLMHKEMVQMFTDEILERFFADKEMQKIPIGTQATAVNAVERVLEQIKEEMPYASLSDLFSTDE